MLALYIHTLQHLLYGEMPEKKTVRIIPLLIKMFGYRQSLFGFFSPVRNYLSKVQFFPGHPSTSNILSNLVTNLSGILYLNNITSIFLQ